MAIGKRTTAARKNIDPTKSYKVMDAVKIVKGNAKAKFDETIEIAVNLGIDPKQVDDAADVLVRLLRVDAEVDGDLDRFVELDRKSVV